MMVKALTAAGKKVEYWEIPRRVPQALRRLGRKRERLERVIAFLKALPGLKPPTWPEGSGLREGLRLGRGRSPWARRPAGAGAESASLVSEVLDGRKHAPWTWPLTKHLEAGGLGDVGGKPGQPPAAAGRPSPGANWRAEIDSRPSAPRTISEAPLMACRVTAEGWPAGAP